MPPSVQIPRSAASPAREFRGDERRLTPEGERRLRHWFARSPHSVILESGGSFGGLGRWSIFATAPDAEFVVRGDRWHATVRGERREGVGPLAAMRRLLQETRRTAEPSGGEIPFRSGWIGFVGYDFAPQLERLPRRRPASSLPDMYWLHFPGAVVVDRQEEVVHEFGDRRGLHRLWEDSEDQSPPLLPPASTPPAPERPREEYLRAVERALEYIRAGDVFQVNLAQRFSTRLREEWRSDEGLAHLWNRCVARSPAPFGALIRTPDWNILSTSPERFLLLEPDGRVETRPIKGTRRRGRNPQEDARLARELETSVKDNAELTMIVDLERNDLGRVCRFGSVQVPRHAAIESYSNVHHLVSTVEGRLRPEFDVVDLLAASFPGGSITGAPKIRAMEIIDELEPVRRGVYTGAIGYIGDDGRADLNIAIRTLVIEGGTAHYHVGGGIVADSDPESEYAETLAKGSRLHAILSEADGDG